MEMKVNNKKTGSLLGEKITGAIEINTVLNVLVT